MSTVDQVTAEKFVSGEWPEDFATYQKLYVYRNAWGQPAFKLAPDGYTLQESGFVGQPKVIWTIGQTRAQMLQGLAEWLKALL